MSGIMRSIPVVFGLPRRVAGGRSQYFKIAAWRPLGICPQAAAGGRKGTYYE
jgi:hypothetical protein